MLVGINKDIIYSLTAGYSTLHSLQLEDRSLHLFITSVWCSRLFSAGIPADSYLRNLQRSMVKILVSRGVS